ncbi:MAG: rubrerythrin family protein [Acidobacteriota bacterium]
MEPSASESAILIENLQSAFEGESNAQARYLEFARKADEESWHGIASLFRAAARAEQIHSANHARILRQLGGEALCIVPPVEIGTTIENLRFALGNERSEVETFYPEFLQQARECRDVTAIRAFMWAYEAEKSHARIFLDAIECMESQDPDSWPHSQKEFCVCPICGVVRHGEDEMEMCGVCHCAWSRFERVR